MALLIIETLVILFKNLTSLINKKMQSVRINESIYKYFHDSTKINTKPIKFAQKKALRKKTIKLKTILYHIKTLRVNSLEAARLGRSVL